MIKLHLGNGDVFLSGYINCDINGALTSEVSKEEIEYNTTDLEHYYKYSFGSPRRNIIYDKKLDLLSFPWNFKDKSIDEIVMISCFEHFTRKEGELIINEINRIMKSGGKFLFDFPDIEETVKQYIKKDPEFCMRLLYCHGRNIYSLHKYGYTFETILSLFNSEWVNIQKVNIIPHNYPIIQILAEKK